MKSAYDPSIDDDNEAFAERVHEIQISQEGKAALSAIRKAKNYLSREYKKAALAHWKERGDEASTGYGCVPAEHVDHTVASCAAMLANKLIEYDARATPDSQPE